MTSVPVLAGPELDIDEEVLCFHAMRPIDQWQPRRSDCRANISVLRFTVLFFSNSLKRMVEMHLIGFHGCVVDEIGKGFRPHAPTAMLAGIFFGPPLNAKRSTALHNGLCKLEVEQPRSPYRDDNYPNG